MVSLLYEMLTPQLYYLFKQNDAYVVEQINYSFKSNLKSNFLYILPWNDLPHLLFKYKRKQRIKKYDP